MSLLMQALRKAEAQKKEAAAQSPRAPVMPASAGAGELTLELKEPTREDIATARERANDLASQREDDLGAGLDDFEAPPAPAAEAVDYFSSELPPPRRVALELSDAAGPQGDVDLVASPPAPSARPVPAGAPPAFAAPDKDDAATLDAASERQRQTAGAVFAAKARIDNRRPWLIGAAGLVLLAAVGAYGYLQFQSIGAPAASGALSQAVLLPAPAPPVPAPPVPDPAAAMPEAFAASAPAAAPVRADVVAPAPAAALFGAAPARARSTPAARAPGPAPASGDSANRIAGRIAPAQPGAPIEVLRSDATRQLNPTLVAAYQSLVGGDQLGAREQYQRVLQQEPDNRDALLGMAAIAVQRGQAAEAGALYKRLLELDPGDAEAASGMAGLQRGDPAQAESALKKVLAASPQTGAAHFALGNVYAEQQRWAEAQQAYFQALGAVPANADYAFNLAVSLDQLGQSRLALGAYQRALALAQRGGSAVSAPAVQARVRALQQELAAPP